MNLREILDRVVASNETDWHRVPGYPVPGAVGFDLSGPGLDEMVITGVRTHHCAAVLVEATEISIAWAMELDRDLSFEFTQRLPDSSVASYAADIMLSGSVVHRVTYIAIDGGRAYLPMPTAMVSSLDFDDMEIIAERVTLWEDGFLSLVNSLTGLREYEGYRDRSGFVVVAGHPLDPR